METIQYSTLQLQIYMLKARLYVTKYVTKYVMYMKVF